MVPVKAITINRAEGLIEECGKPVTVATFAEAQAVLIKWGQTAPKGGGYDKVDFSVVWEDGEHYKGRYDMVYGGMESDGATLASHISDYLTFLTGSRKPDHMKEQDYRNCIARYVKENPNHIKEITDFLAKYQIA
jgi:hypothetical protein